MEPTLNSPSSPPPAPPGEFWREAAENQRRTFEREDSTVAAMMFRDLGAGRTWAKKLAWLRQALWASQPGGLFLELGTGEGTGHHDTSLYPPRHVGIDPAASALSRARQRWPGPGVASRWAAAFGEELPFLDATFDGVFGIDTSHHLASPERAFAEMARVLKPGGRMAFVEPNPRYPVNLVFLFSRVERGLFSIRRPVLAGWAARAGLTALEVDHVPVFFPSFPQAFAETYDRAERALGRLPGVRGFSTARTVVATRPAEAISGPDPGLETALEVAAHDLSAVLRLPLVETALAQTRGPYLDVGSGPGLTVGSLLAPRDALTVCLDVDEGNLRALQVALACASRPSRVALVRADATRLPFRDGAFATVLACEVLEHIADDGSAVAEMARVLEPGGIACVTVPSTRHRHDSILAALSIETVHDLEGPEHHVRPGYDPAGLCALLARNGLEPEAPVEYLRHASRLAVDFVGLAHLLVERRARATGDAGGRRGWTWSEAVERTRVSFAFRVYRRLFPCLKAFTRLDSLFTRAPAWQVLVRAVRRQTP